MQLQQRPVVQELKRLPRAVVRVSGFGLLCAAFGLLLWARFLLVTGHPRTAMAVPRPLTPVPTQPQQTEAPTTVAQHPGY